MAIIGVDTAGEEIRRFDKPVRNYIGIWDGTFDNRGRYWREILHSDDDDENWVSPVGLGTLRFRHYYKSYDLSNGTVDSVYTGEVTTRRYTFETDGGGGSQGIPFTASDLTVVNPSGGFWRANTASYRLTLTDENVDTVLIVEAGTRDYPVTADDRSAYVDNLVERRPDLRRVAEAVAALIPDRKPMLGAVFVDDETQLWVERAVPSDTPPFYDLFSEDGDYLGSVRFGFMPAPNSRIWVQHGNVYTWVVDEFEVPYVVRALCIVRFRIIGLAILHSQPGEGTDTEFAARHGSANVPQVPI